MNHHITRLEIDRQGLLENVRYFKSKTHKNTKLLSVVKAYGYGTSAILVADAIKNEVDYFAVAYTDEGIALRKAGINHPILVLHPQKQNISLLIDYELEPNCYSFLMLQKVIEVVKLKKLTSYPIHLKINTGLNRIGFDANEIDNLIEILSKQQQVEVISIFSHIAASEDASEKEFTKNQIAQFKSVVSHLSSELQQSKMPMQHMTNTSGILNYANKAQFDMIRLGIGMYGFGNDTKITKILSDVLCLKSIISQIHLVEKGKTIGYNRAFKTSKITRIATIPIGHADGYLRRLGNGKGYMYVNNQKAYVVGNVCMDMIMLDVTDIPCNENDEVIVYKNQHHIEDLAKRSHTISYEILTSISQRVRRILVDSK